jgi:hypothetical protein
MKFAAERPYGDPDKAARKLVDIANAVEPAQDGRIFIELINWPFLHDQKGSPAEYKAGLELAIARGWPSAAARWAPIRYFHPGLPKPSAVRAHQRGRMAYYRERYCSGILPGSMLR